MRGYSTVLGCGAMALCLGSLVSACDASGDQPMRLVLPGMSHSLPYNGYDANPVTGQTALVPPDGTVPMGHTVFDYEPGKEEAVRAGVELENPVTDFEASLPRGKRVYDTFCAVCHGPAGEGDGPIIGRFPNPPSLLAPRAKGLPDGHLFHVITYGQGLMVPYATQVRVEDRWKTINYIRSLQGTQGGAQ